jgi:HEAT repeat protein
MYVLWGVALAFLLTAGLLCWNVAMPIMRARRVVPHVRMRGGSMRPSPEALPSAAVDELGGQRSAGHAVSLYLFLPRLEQGNKIRAVWVLGHCGPHGVGALTRMLDSGDHETRLQAAKALGWLGSDAAPAVPALARALAAEDTRLRRAVAVTLGEIGPEAAAAVPALLKARCVPDEALQFEIVRSFGKIGPGASEAVPDLLRITRNKKHDLRSSAVLSLAQIQSPDEFARFLTKCMEAGDPSDFLDLLAALAWAEPSSAASAFPALKCALRHKDEQLRMIAVCALPMVGPRAAEAMPELIKIAGGPRTMVTLHLPTGGGVTHDLRAAAIWTLGTMGPKAKGAIPLLERLASDKNQDVREAATKGLKRIKAKEEKQ